MSSNTPDHTWDEDHPITTLTLVEGLSRADVARVLQADTANEWLSHVGDVDVSPTKVGGRWMHPVQLFEDAGWVVLLEPNGSAGIHPSLTGPLSQAGSLVALYCGINAEMEFRYAVAGTLRRVFEPLAWPDGQQGEPLPQEAGLVFGLPEPQHNPFQQAVLLAERLTGLRLTNEWVLGEERPTVLAPTSY